MRALQPTNMKAFFNLFANFISLGLGEPGLPTSLFIGAGGIAAIESGSTSYPPSNGYFELRRETATYLSARFGYAYDADEVLITSYASGGLDCIMRTFVKEPS